MGGFLYFVPEHVTAIGQLAGWGMDYAFAPDGKGFSPVQGKGPGGVSGTIVADERHLEAAKITYQPGDQIWKKATRPEGTKLDGVMIGMWKDARPTPHELERSDALAGHVVRMADGHDWRIPVARSWIEDGEELRWYANLPRRMELSEEGRWRPGSIVEKYAHLWRAAETYWDAFVRGGISRGSEGVQVQLEIDDVLGLAVTAMAANYRVSAVELDLLGVFDERNFGEVLRALIDWPAFEAHMQKKTERKESETSPTEANCNAGGG